MTRNFLNSIGRAAGLPALLLALPLAGWAAPARLSWREAQPALAHLGLTRGRVWLRSLRSRRLQ